MENEFANLYEITSEEFDNINFSELNIGWIDRMIDNEFTDMEEINLTTSILFSSSDPLNSINKISKVCNMWCNRLDQSTLTESRLNNISHQDDTLWSYLYGLDITAKHIQGFIYFICTTANKRESTVEDKELGLGCANLYFVCLKVPGSSAYSVYHPMLFRLCVDCLYIPSNFPDTKDTIWKENGILLPMMVAVLESLLPILSTFHLGSDTEICDHVIKKLSDLVGWELAVNNINFSVDMLNMPAKERIKHFSWSVIVSALSFQGLQLLIDTDLNGEKDHNYTCTLFYTFKYILLSKVKKRSNITQKVQVPKENVVNFLCATLKSEQELRHPICVEALKRASLLVSDGNEMQHVVSTAIFKILHCLRTESISTFLQWLLLLADSSDTGNRTFALVCHSYCINFTKESKENMSEEEQIYFTPIPYVFSVLTRCDDVSPSVRTCALATLSDNMRSILSSIMDFCNSENNVPQENFERDIPNSAANGNHRIFWYHLGSFRNILSEISNMLQRRISDTNAPARCNAVKALENLVNFDITYLSNNMLKVLVIASKDGAVTVRKQVLQSLTSILNKHPYDQSVQSSWLTCTLPLVMDPETTVLGKVFQIMEERFLINIFSDKEAEQMCTFNLLEHLCNGEFLSHQRFIQKAFKLWHKDNKLRPAHISKLEKHLDSTMKEYVWFYIGLYSVFSKIPLSTCELAVKELRNQENWDEYNMMEHILKTLSFSMSSLPHNEVEIIKDILVEKIQDLSVPIELYPVMIEALRKILRQLKKDDELEEFAANCIQKSYATLSPYLPENSHLTQPADVVSFKTLTIIKEFCQIHPKLITEELTRLLKTIVYANKFTCEKKLYPCSKKISPVLRAHGFAAIGKLCLQDETLVKFILPLMAQEIISSSVDVIRNNVVVVMIEMCKRYTAHADKYIPLISVSFKDRAFVIRYQAITMLANLLQEDYIKWRGSLFFCLVATVIDKKEAIRELGKYCLCHLLLEKKQSAFADQFVDSIFVFNHWIPPNNKKLGRYIRDLERFAIVGDENRDQRMQIYLFMLLYMTADQKRNIITQVCNDVLNSFSDSVFPITDETSVIMRDCFAILASKEIRIVDVDEVNEAGDNDDQHERETAIKFEKDLRFAYLVKPLIPVVVGLKNACMYVKTDLVSQMVDFLVEILEDYREKANELLAADKTLDITVSYRFRAADYRSARKNMAKNNQNSPPVFENAAVAVSPRTPSRQVAERYTESGEDVFTVNGVRVSPASRAALDHDAKITSTPRVLLRPIDRDLDISRIALESDMDCD